MFLDLESTEAAALDSFNVSVLVAINDVIFFSQCGSEIEVVYVRLVQASYQRWPSLCYTGEFLGVSTAIKVFEGLPSLP